MVNSWFVLRVEFCRLETNPQTGSPQAMGIVFFSELLDGEVSSDSQQLEDTNSEKNDDVPLPIRGILSSY